MNPNDPRTERLDGELEKLYEEQIAMLKDRCDAYYQGKFYEAKSAAAILYILLCDHGGSQKSLLGQLKKKENIKFLDSRQLNDLTINSSSGAWPRTVIPFKPFRNENLYEFEEWWTKQPFKIVFKNIEFTRQELVEAIRHKEGGGHVSPLTLKKIAAVRRNRSGWHRSIEKKEDGTTQMYVGVSLSRDPVPEDSNLEEISDYELASVCAIAEEVLFSITPEPENRLRMHHEDYKKPFYLTKEESDKCKEEIRNDIRNLELLSDFAPGDEGIVMNIKKSMEKVLEIECLTSEDCQIRKSVEENLKLFEIDWPPKT